MLTLVTFIQSRLALKDEKGATAVEYGLLVTLIALVMAVGAATLGDNLSDLFDGIKLG